MAARVISFYTLHRPRAHVALAKLRGALAPLGATGRVYVDDEVRPPASSTQRASAGGCPGTG